MVLKTKVGSVIEIISDELHVGDEVVLHDISKIVNGDKVRIVRD